MVTMTTSLVTDIANLNSAPDAEDWRAPTPPASTPESVTSTENIQNVTELTDEVEQISTNPLPTAVLTCIICKQDYTNRDELYKHTLHHLKTPKIQLEHVRVPSLIIKRSFAKKHIHAPNKNLKLTVKTTNNNFQIVKSPDDHEHYPKIPKLRILLPEQLSKNHDEANKSSKMVELQSLPNESQSPSFPSQSPSQPESVASDTNSFWSTPDPTGNENLHRESGEREAETHNNLLQSFLSDDHLPKETHISSNDTEYISLERLAGPQCAVCGDRFADQSTLEVHYKQTGHYPQHHGALLPYGQVGPPMHTTNPLDSLTNIPMQQLAQQVNRLQPGPVHQQNVLINIQQFGQPMPSPYRTPEMPPHMGYPPQQQHPMYRSPYHPPPHMFYPPNTGMYPNYPPAPMMPPQNQAPPRPPPPQNLQAMQNMQGISQPPMAPPSNIGRPRAPRQHTPRTMPPRGPRPIFRAPIQQPRMQKRPTLPTQLPPDKKKRLDVLIPDTNDDADCHVISMQTCKDGLPVIKNVQGATVLGDSNDPVVHLTDSITLSVRNPKEQQAAVQIQQKKNDAKAVANILATRGITVTPATKSQQKDGTQKNDRLSPPVAINLNSAVSIIPTARNGNSKPPNEKGNSPQPPTVDLTDDGPPAPSPQKNPQQNPGRQKGALPHQCDLCPAQYPTLQSLMNHRRTYHKVGPNAEFGVPIVDLKQANVVNKLSSIGISNFIPLPQMGGPGSTFAMPIVSMNAIRNPNVCNVSALGSSAVLTLGPVRHISNLGHGK